ncbi:MAG: S-methyl-5-thioribose-1-phosphate isomerase [Candidatus Omnitrophota bacterium]|nr:MAG: S-methyl-5-thioribose-1-phosphate isomerase [Candidatus Omnitrophota bacterium]
MDIRTLGWLNNRIKIIDQTQLPVKCKYISISNLKGVWQAIKTMQVRGAPALGAAAAFGVYLGVRKSRAKKFAHFIRELDTVIKYLNSSRPTARNLFWGLEKMRELALKNKHKKIPEIKKLLLKQAFSILEDDRARCRKIGYHGNKLIKNNDTVLTICNAGILATIDYGTALGALYSAKQAGKKFKVYACETRPMLQGARLTTWELNKKGIDVTLICDSMAAVLMKKGKIDKVITGADRIALNGDTANKIGTYSLAVLCRYHKIPFYVAAPISTFDFKLKSGRQIPIEHRKREEVTELFFKRPISGKAIKVFNPVFDVTPHYLITAFITDKGTIKPPYRKNIKKLMAKEKSG